MLRAVYRMHSHGMSDTYREVETLSGSYTCKQAVSIRQLCGGNN